MSSFPLVIAEAGVNHNGDPDLAIALIDAAARARADIVKFQTFRAEAMVAAGAPKADYQLGTTNPAESQLDMLRKLELPPGTFPVLAAHASRRGIGFLSTPFDCDSVKLLAAMGLKRVKVPSGEITNLPFLRAIAAHDWDVLLSTGMSELSEVAEALKALEEAGLAPGRVTLLHCTTEYPAPFAQVNLRAMDAMGKAFPACAGIGYSDHTPGLEIAVAAAARGAVCIEKHFTLDRAMAGPDHQASLEPDELKTLVSAVRHVSAALGTEKKTVAAAEAANRSLVRKSIVAARDIAKGEILTSQNLTVKRPGTGVSPMLWDAILGSPAPRDLRKDELL